MGQTGSISCYCQAGVNSITSVQCGLTSSVLQHGLRVLGGGRGLVLLDWTYNRKNVGRNTSFQASCYQH